jgi:hypothetical protein
MIQKKTNFAPNYLNIQNAALNKPTERMPLYEHGISDKIMEQISGRQFRQLSGGDVRDKSEYFREVCNFYSCGSIFEIMPDLIDIAKIDAKHSNEDQIADFSVWLEKYGDRIGNFGGIDTDAVCRLSLPDIREHIRDLLGRCRKKGGMAFSSGNTIPDYVPADHYLEMVNTVREIRGDYS